MRDEDKPFVMYRGGPGNFRIVPRGWAGWRITLIWMATVVPIIGFFMAFAMTDPKPPMTYIGPALFMMAMAAWGIGGTVWMRARAEVVDLQELLELKRQRDREKGRR